MSSRTALHLVTLALLTLPARAAAADHPKTDAAGDPLPPGAVARLGALRVPLGAETLLSPDGKTLVVSAYEETGVRAFDFASGKELRRFGWAPGFLFTFALSADGKKLAVAGGALPVRIWDLEKQREVCRCVNSPDPITRLAFSPDGETLIGTHPDLILRQWNAATGKERRRLGNFRVGSLAYSSDSKTVTVLDYKGEAHVLDAVSGAEQKSFKLQGAKGAMMAWISPARAFFVGGVNDGVIRLWDGAGTFVRSLETPKGLLLAAAFSHDSKLVATFSHREKMIRLWNPATGENLRALPVVGNSSVSCLAFTADSKTLFGLTQDGVLRRWDVGAGAILGVPEGLIEGPQRMTLSPDGKTLVTGGPDGSVRFWDFQTSRELRRLIRGGPEIQSLALSPNGKRLATRSPGADVRLWDVETGKEMAPVKAAGNNASLELVFSADSSMIAFNGPAPRLCQVETGRERARLAKDVGARAVLFTAADKSLITLGHDSKVHVWSTNSGKEQREIANLPTAAGGVLSPDGKELVLRTIAGPSVLVIDFTTGKSLRQWPIPPGGHSVGFLNGGKELFTSSYYGPRVSAPPTGKDLAPLPGHRSPVLAAVFRDGGRTIVSIGADRALRFWDVATGRQSAKIEKLPGVGWERPLAALTPDGAVLAVAGEGNSVFLCDVSAAKPLHRALASKRSFTRLATSPDGRTVALATSFPAEHQILEAATGAERAVLKNNIHLAFVPNRDQVVVVEQSSPTLHLVDIKEKKARLDVAIRPPWTMGPPVFSRDGTMMAVGGAYGLVHVFEFSTGRERFSFRASIRGDVSALAFSPDGRWMATGIDQGDVCIWRTAPTSDKTGAVAVPLVNRPADQEVKFFRGHRRNIHSLAFSPSGKMLVSASADTTGLVWDLSDVKARPVVERSREEIEQWWIDLRSDDAVVAFRAVTELIESPEQSLPVLRARLTAKVEMDAGQVKRLIGELGDSDRQKEAAEQLWRIGRRVEPALRAALEANADASATLKALLERFKGHVPPPDWLQTLRAVEAIERAGGPAARKVLERLTRSGNADLVALARAALARREER